MTQEDVLVRIGTLLKELTEEHAALKNKSLDFMSINLFEAKCNFLREHSAILKQVVIQNNSSLNSNSRVDVRPQGLGASPNLQPVEQENKIQNIVSVDPIIGINNENKAVVSISTQSVSPVSLDPLKSSLPANNQKSINMPLIDDLLNNDKSKVDVKLETKPKEDPIVISNNINKIFPTVASVSAEKEELNSKFNQNRPPSLNDSIAIQNANKVELKTQISSTISKQNAQLKSSIGINDKFLLLKGLFNNDVTLLDKALESLDECQTPERTLQRLKTLQIQFQWSDKSDVLRKFVELVMRRF